MKSVEEGGRAKGLALDGDRTGGGCVGDAARRDEIISVDRQ
jgi:hypothetical protein